MNFINNTRPVQSILAMKILKSTKIYVGMKFLFQGKKYVVKNATSL